MDLILYLYPISFSRGFYYVTAHCCGSFILLTAYCFGLNRENKILLTAALFLIIGSYFENNKLESTYTIRIILDAAIAIQNTLINFYYCLRFGKVLSTKVQRFIFILLPFECIGVFATAMEFGVWANIMLFLSLSIVYLSNMYSWYKIVVKAKESDQKTIKLKRLVKVSNIIGGVFLLSPFVIVISSIYFNFINYIYFPIGLIIVIISDFILNMNKSTRESTVIWIAKSVIGNELNNYI